MKSISETYVRWALIVALALFGTLASVHDSSMPLWQLLLRLVLQFGIHIGALHVMFRCVFPHGDPFDYVTSPFFDEETGDTTYRKEGIIQNWKFFMYYVKNVLVIFATLASSIILETLFGLDVIAPMIVIRELVMFGLLWYSWTLYLRKQQEKREREEWLADREAEVAMRQTRYLRQQGRS